MSTAVVFGGTGAVGKPLVNYLVQTSSFTNIHSFVRNPKNTAPEATSGKQFQEHTVDFEKLLSHDQEEISKIKNIKADAVFITLGTTRADAGSAAQFKRIDREYVLAAASAAKNEDHPAKILYCSCQGASSSTPFLYLQSKGLTEEGLAKLHYQDTILFRPAMLASTNRENKRVLEDLFGKVTGLLSRFTASLEIAVPALAKAMVQAAELGPSELKNQNIGSSPSGNFNKIQDSIGNVTVIGNAEAVKLSATTTP